MTNNELDTNKSGDCPFNRNVQVEAKQLSIWDASIWIPALAEG